LFNGILTFAVIYKVIQQEQLRQGVAVIWMNLAWFGNTFFEIDVSWWPVPSPQGALVGLPHTKQRSKAPNWTMNHCKSVAFLSNFRMSSLLKIYRRRFCWWRTKERNNTMHVFLRKPRGIVLKKRSGNAVPTPN